MNAVLHSFGLSLRAVLLAAALCSAAACGLKGPLYMPDQKPDMVEVKTPPVIPIPNTQKKERSDDKQSSGSTQPAQTPPEP